MERLPTPLCNCNSPGMMYLGAMQSGYLENCFTRELTKVSLDGVSPVFEKDLSCWFHIIHFAKFHFFFLVFVGFGHAPKVIKELICLAGKSGGTQW